MAITLISTPAYNIDFPGFEHYEFSGSSSEKLTLPQAVAFEQSFGGVLQSAREAVAFRIAADGADNSRLYQKNKNCSY